MIGKLFRRMWFLKMVACYLRRSNLELARWRIVRWALPVAREILPGQGHRIVRTRHGFVMKADLNEWLGQYVYLTGECEEQTSRVFEAFLHPGDVVVDVGAQVGFFSLLASRCVGDSGQVYAFEPVPFNRDSIKANLELNRYRNCTVMAEAVSDRSGESWFFEGPANHRGISALRPFEKSVQKYLVRTKMLDELIPQDRKLALVKIDVEGAELKVIRGMSRLIDSYHPDIILEMTDKFLREMGDSAEELCTELLGRGYRMYSIDYDGLRPLTGWSEDQPWQYNALFTQREDIDKGLLAEK